MRRRQRVAVGSLALLALASRSAMSLDRTSDGEDDLGELHETSSAAKAVIEPGRVNGMRASMPKSAALSSGYFTDSPELVDENCPAVVNWQSGYRSIFDVVHSGNGDVLSLGVWRAGPATSDGIGVGSTLAELQSSGNDYRVVGPVPLTPAKTAIYWYEASSLGWMGFLFDSAMTELTGDSRVSFIELSIAKMPTLDRSDCSLLVERASSEAS